MDPALGPASAAPVTVAQVTVPTGAVFTASVGAQGRSATGPDWQETGLVFSNDPAREQTAPTESVVREQPAVDDKVAAACSANQGAFDAYTRSWAGHSAAPSATAVSCGGVPGYTTYALSLELSDSTENVYAIFGRADAPMSLPAAWQETSVGVNIGGVSPVIVTFEPTAQFDSWLTVAATGEALNDQIAAIGIEFASWTVSSPLQVTDGAVFWTHPGSAPTGLQRAAVGQVTVPSGTVFSATFGAQGRSVSGPDWQEAVLLFTNDPMVQSPPAVTAAGEEIRIEVASKFNGFVAASTAKRALDSIAKQRPGNLPSGAGKEVHQDPEITLSHLQTTDFELQLPGFDGADFSGVSPSGRARDSAVRRAVALAVDMSDLRNISIKIGDDFQNRRLQDSLTIAVQVRASGDAADAVHDHMAGLGLVTDRITSYLSDFGVNPTGQVQMSQPELTAEIVFAAVFTALPSTDRAGLAASMLLLQDAGTLLAAVTQVRKTPSWLRSWANFQPSMALFSQECMGQLSLQVAGDVPGVPTSCSVTVLVGGEVNPSIAVSAPPPPSALSASCGRGTRWDAEARRCLPDRGAPARPASADPVAASAIACGVGTAWDTASHACVGAELECHTAAPGETSDAGGAVASPRSAQLSAEHPRACCREQMRVRGDSAAPVHR
jgi:hypothetical protein